MTERQEATHIPTEEELLAMDASEYMSPEQLAFFRERLRAERDELMSSADRTLEQLRSQETVIEEGDRAQADEEYALQLRLRDRERRLLNKIDEAMRRIEHGEYGFCQETGEPIGLRRLLARPTATLSVEGQELKEQQEKGFQKDRESL